MKDRICQSMDSTERRAAAEACGRRCSIVLLCIPVVGWLILGILFVVCQCRPPFSDSPMFLYGMPEASRRTGKPFCKWKGGNKPMASGLAVSCTVEPHAVHYEEELSRFYQKFSETTLDRSYKGMIHTLGHPLQLVSLLIVHGEGTHQYERYLRLLVSNESSERLNYCEWRMDWLYMENGHRHRPRIEPLRFYQDIPPWSSSVLFWNLPLPAGAVDIELHLKIAMFASSSKAVVYDTPAKTVCQWPPQRLADVYPRVFIDRYLIKHDIGLYPLYVYEEQADDGIQFSHCPFCGHFNLTSYDECRCCRTSKETQRLFQTQVLAAAYQEF